MKKTTKKSREHGAPSSTKNLASFIFSFLLSITLVLIAVIFIAGNCFSKRYVVSRFDEDYIRMLSEAVYHAAVDYTMPTGVEVSVLDGVFTEDRILEDVKSYATNTFDNHTYTVDTSAIEDTLTENVKTFLLQQGIDVSENQDAIDEYVQDICKIYRDRVKLPGLNYISQLSNLYKKYFLYLIAGSVIFALVNAFLCIKLHSYLHRGLRYVVYSFGGAAIMTFAAPFIAFLNGFYKNLQISPNYFNHFLVSFIENVFFQLFIWAATYLVLSGVTLLIVYVRRKRVARKPSRH